MVEAATVGKSQVPVSLKFELLQRPVQGQPLEIAIALLPQIPARPATIEVTGLGGLRLGAGEDQIEIRRGRARAGLSSQHQAHPDGGRACFCSTLNVSLKHDQTTDSRVFSVPIIVVPSAQRSRPQPRWKRATHRRRRCSPASKGPH